MHGAAREQGLASRLAELTLATAQGPLPAGALQAAARLVQHAFGVCAAGSDLPVARIARAALDEARGPCLLFGSASLCAAQDAAFANAVAGHASLLEDSGPGGLAAGSHPGTYVFPSALAAAQSRRATGLQLLQAVCAAYECVDRLGTLTPAEATQRGFRAVPLLGPFGAVAAAGVLSGLDAAQLACAFGIASNLAGGLNQGFVDGTMEPYLHPAFAARNGLLAVRLAQGGATASPLALEGERGFFAAFAGRVPEAESLTPRDKQEELAVCRVGTKDYATCLYNQGTLALIQRAFPGGLRAADVQRVTLRRPQRGVHGFSAPGVAAAPPYATPLQRQMSARFTAAAALLGRPVDQARCYAESDPEIEELAGRIELLPHEAPGVCIEVTSPEGAVRHAQADGASALVFSGERTAAAFEQRARPLLGARADDASALLGRLHELESLQPLCALFLATADSHSRSQA